MWNRKLEAEVGSVSDGRG